jgi:hypothetical protein
MTKKPKPKYPCIKIRGRRPQQTCPSCGEDTLNRFGTCDAKCGWLHIEILMCGGCGSGSRPPEVSYKNNVITIDFRAKKRR